MRTKRLLRTAKAQGNGPESLFLGQVDELSRKIAAGQGVAKEKIDASLRPIGDVSTRSEEAYKYFLQGSTDLDNMQYTKARESLEKAVEIDPEFAIAYSQLADAYAGEGNTPAFKQALEKAHSLSKNAPEKERLQIEGCYADEIENNRDKWASHRRGACGQVSQGEGFSHRTWRIFMQDRTRKEPSRNTTSP